MKKLLTVLGLCIFAQTTVSQSVTQTPEVKVVKEILELFLVGTLSQENIKKSMSLISPAYLKNKGASSKKIVKIYAPGKYRILSQNGKIVIAEIWNDKLNWKKRMFFKVEKENGKYYIVPNQNAFISSSGSIIPYTRADDYKKGKGWVTEYNPQLK